MRGRRESSRGCDYRRQAASFLGLLDGWSRPRRIVCGKLRALFTTLSFLMSKPEPLYKVIFLNQGQVYEMYAKQIFQSDLWGFLEIEEFVFGERTQVVVDPSEEKLKAQFDGVVRSFVPMHAVIRIDEVERLGTPKISEAKGGGNVMPFPLPMPER